MIYGVKTTASVSANEVRHVPEFGQGVACMELDDSLNG
jgi:hypothetical protein